jgi:excisionase family DNA binding protein
MPRQDARLQLEPLLTARDVAELLALSPHTILDKAEAGELPSFKLGHAVRFRQSEIATWIETQRRQVAA